MYARTLQNRREVISDLPLPIPLGQDRFKQFPSPGPEGLDLLPGIARGMVTGQIEPCIGNWIVWYGFLWVIICLSATKNKANSSLSVI